MTGYPAEFGCCTLKRCQCDCRVCGHLNWKCLCLYHHHHHHRVARPSVSIAVSTSWRHFEQSCARFHVVLRPRLRGRRSISIVRSHVRLGPPARRRQSAGGRLMAALRMREWSCDGSALARCPNRRSRLFAITDVTGGWIVLRLTSSLVICAVYGICSLLYGKDTIGQMHRDWMPQSYSTCQLCKEVLGECTHCTLCLYRSGECAYHA